MADEVQSTQQTVVADPPVNETPEQKYARLYPGQNADTKPDANAAIVETLQALRSELAEVRNGIARPQVVAAMPEAQQLEWVDKIQKGDFKGAQESMASFVKAQVLADMQPKLDLTAQQAYQNGLNASQVSVEMDRHLQSVRAANPDLIAFEKYLTAPVTERIQLAQAAKRIQTPADFIREYKTALDAEVANLRNLGQQFRAAGKDEATTRINDVVRSTTLSPQQVQSTQASQTDSQANASGESTDDYFTRRAAWSDRAHGRG